MSDGRIAEMIRRLNKGVPQKHVLLSAGDRPVRRGRAWPRLPNGDQRVHGYDFWFIFVERVCVGAVLRQDDGDLHAYTSRRYRRRGLMRRALVEHIFPELAIEGNEAIEVSLGSAGGRALWRSVGGDLTQEGRKGHLRLSAFTTTAVQDIERGLLTATHREAICATLLHASQLLRYCSDALMFVKSEQAGLEAKLALIAEGAADARAMVIRPFSET
jgi:hypothetical protein